MQWFYQWFLRKLEESRDYANRTQRATKARDLLIGSSPGVKYASEDLEATWQDGLKINVKKVNGGFVITFYRYDRKTDREDHRHYIITDDHDFNAELGKLISLESMRQS